MENKQIGNHNNNAQGSGNVVGSVINDSTINMVFSTEKDGRKQSYEARASKYLTIADSWLSIVASLVSLLSIGGFTWLVNLITAGYNSGADIITNVNSILESRIFTEGNRFPEILIPLFIFIISLLLVPLLLKFKKFGKDRIMHLFRKESKYFLAGFSKNGKNRIGLFKITGECILCSGGKKGVLKACMMPQKFFVTWDKNGRVINKKAIEDSAEPVLICQRNKKQHIFNVELTDYQQDL